MMNFKFKKGEYFINEKKGKITLIFNMNLFFLLKVNDSFCIFLKENNFFEKIKLNLYQSGDVYYKLKQRAR